MKELRIRDYVLSVVYLASITFLFAVPRENFIQFFSLYSLVFLLYFVLVSNYSGRSKLLNFLLIGSFVISLFFTPQLSNDYFRFLWDGELQHLGLNPLSFKPNELIHQEPFKESAYFQNLYEGMGKLSAKNYSCYPTIKQLVFNASTLFGDMIWLNLLILKFTQLILLLPIYYFLKTLLQLVQLPKERMYWFLLNPLVLLEVIANLHFEGIMFSFLIAALYYILQRRMLLSTILLAAAVNVKLTPLIILPFLWRFLGPVWASIYYLLCLVFSFSIALIYLSPSNYLFFIESLSLYFKTFEFNSSVFYYYIQYGRWTDGWNKIRYFGPRLARYTIMLLTVVALYGTFKDWQTLFRRILLGYFIYLLLSSTIHPWYLIVPLGLSLFTSFSFVIIWSFLVMLSYYYYSSSGTQDPILRSLILIEYLIVIAVLLYELYRKKAILRTFRI